MKQFSFLLVSDSVIYLMACVIIATAPRKFISISETIDNVHAERICNFTYS